MTTTMDKYYERTTEILDEMSEDMNPLIKKEEPELQTFMCTVFRKATLVCEVPIRAYSEDELDEELKKFETVTLAATEVWQESDGDEIDSFWILEDKIASEEE